MPLCWRSTQKKEPHTHICSRCRMISIAPFRILCKSLCQLVGRTIGRTSPKRADTAFEGPIEKMRMAIEHTHTHTRTEFGWLRRTAQTKAKQNNFFTT